MAHRAGTCSSCAGWYLEFQLPVSEESQLVLPLQVVPVQVSQVHLWREQGVTAALRGTRAPVTPSLPLPPCPHPMPQGLGEAASHLPRCLEELVGEMLGKEGKHHVGASGISFKLLPQQEPLCQELGVGELQLACEGWRLRADAQCRPRWVLVLSAVSDGCSIWHRLICTDTLQPSHTGHDMPQQLSLSCPSSISDAIKLLLLWSQPGQDSGSTWHCQWCLADVSMAMKAWPWLGGKHSGCRSPRPVTYLWSPWAWGSRPAQAGGRGCSS